MAISPAQASEQSSSSSSDDDGGARLEQSPSPPNAGQQRGPQGPQGSHSFLQDQGPGLLPSPAQPRPFMAKLQRVMSENIPPSNAPRPSSGSAGAGEASTSLVLANRHGAATPHPGNASRSGVGQPANFVQAMSSISALSSSVSEEDLHPAVRRIHETCRESQQRIYALLGYLRDRPDLPHNVVRGLEVDLEGLNSAFISVDTSAAFIQHLLVDNANSVQNARTMCTTAAIENEELRSQIRKLEAELLNESEIKHTYRDMINSLNEKDQQSNKEIQHLKEQLEGKRSLWAQSDNPSAEEKSTALQPMDQSSSMDRMTTPSTSAGSSGYMMSHVTPTAGNIWNSGGFRQSSSGPLIVPQQLLPPPTPSRSPYPTGPYGGPRSSVSRSGSRPMSRAVSRGQSLPGGQARFNFDDAQSLLPSGAMTSHELNRYGGGNAADNEAEARAAELATKFEKIFVMVLGFAQTYVKTDLGPAAARTLRSTAPRLWEYMCDVLYPGRPEIGTAHTEHLLREPDSLPFFVARLLIQYIINSMFATEGWMSFDDDADRDLRDATMVLQNTDVCKPADRQAAVDKQARVINRIVSNEKFLQFKQFKTNYHSQRLKTIVGPLLHHDNDTRRRANVDVDIITTAVLDLSAELFSSRLSFQYVWPDTCSKFAQESHVAFNDTIAAVTMQIKQYRLKLVVTPGITMRNDQAGTIMPRRILRARVLVMN